MRGGGLEAAEMGTRPAGLQEGTASEGTSLCLRQGWLFREAAERRQGQLTPAMEAEGKDLAFNPRAMGSHRGFYARSSTF